MPTTGVALVGTGFIGPVHTEALARLGKRLVGVLGSTPEKSKQAAKSLRAERGYDCFADLLLDRDVAVVHLTSPNRHHFAQAADCLQAGKHVVCEKPLAMNAQESAQLVALAAQSPNVAAVCYNIRYYPLCLEMRQRIASGELGEIYHVSGSYTQDWLLHETDFNWRVLSSEGGKLRAVADIGTHWLDLVQFLTGQAVNEVCADLKTLLPTRRRPVGSVETFQSNVAATVPIAVDTEDYGSCLLGFTGGARGVFNVSQMLAGRKNCVQVEIAGSKGSLAWNSERPNELWLGHRGRANQLLVRDPALLHPEVRPFANYPGGHNEGFPDTFKQLFRAVYQTIEAQAPVTFPTFADGHREIVLCEAIWQSHVERRWQKGFPS